MKNETHLNRREFLKQSAAAGLVVLGAAASAANAEDAPAGGIPPKRIKVGVIGCGSVSHHYFPNLKACPFADVVSCCDIIYERAQRAAKENQIPHHYPHIDQMLAGADFDLLVNITDMQEHGRLNKIALQAGKNVWSEKPMANSYAQGKELLDLAKQRGLRIWGAPTVVTSPQFAFMAKTLAKGTLGRIAAAHASYGHLGPDWSPFFYERGGGSLPDLGVYNITTLTGLLGPAKEIVAMTSIVTPARDIRGKTIQVEAEDNAMLVMDHGNSVLSHVQCGFNYFTAHEHDSTRQSHHTIDIVGSGGSMHMAGYDWAPHAVDLANREQPALKRYATDGGGYSWQYGASLVAECLATGKETLITPEHALHVVEILAAIRRSQRSGRRVPIRSSFAWPLIT
jgi:predicted dehydrogenase